MADGATVVPGSGGGNRADYSDRVMNYRFR